MTKPTSGQPQVGTQKLITEVVTQDGESFSGDWVISGIHPKNTFSLVSNPEVLTPAFRDRVSHLQETSVFLGFTG